MMRSLAAQLSEVETCLEGCRGASAAKPFSLGPHPESRMILWQGDQNE